MDPQPQKQFVAYALRQLSPEEGERNGQSADVVRIDLTITTFREKELRTISATTDAFGDMVVGIGRTHRGAAEDLVDAVQTVCDHHIEAGTFATFMSEYFAQPLTSYEVVSSPAAPTTAMQRNWLEACDETALTSGRAVGVAVAG